ncbi:hypothetical protein [Angelakisella massiliensis]|uniref:hypothetical protein n=1 Tax=Angelakisella massiliensis TaxID=1871018 RepID=UPI0023A85A30|nr:hypothetical protein [Angelakisella massiliensis]
MEKPLPSSFPAGTMARSGGVRFAPPAESFAFFPKIPSACDNEKHRPATDSLGLFLGTVFLLSCDMGETHHSV